MMHTELIGRLPPRPHILFGRRSLGSIVLGTCVGQGIVLASSPLLTRLYSPSDFGALTAFTALASILSAAATLRLEAAITLPQDDADAAAVAWAALCSLAIVTIGLGALTSVAGGSLCRAFGSADIAGLEWLLPVTVAAIGVSQVLSTWMVRERRYDALGVRSAAQGVGQVAAQAILGLLAVRPLGLLAGIAAGRLIGCGGLASQHGLMRQRVIGRQLRTAISTYRRFPLMATGSAVLNNVGMYAPFLIIGIAYGQVALGLAGLTARVLAMPAALMGQAVASHYQGEASAVLRLGTPRLHQTLRRTAGRLLMIGLLPAGVIILFGPSIFVAAFGAVWTDAGEFARLLAVGYLAQFAVSPVSQTLNLLQRQGQQLCWDLSRLILTSAGPLACAAAGRSIMFAVCLLSLTYVTAYVLLYVCCAAAAKEHDTVTVIGHN